MLQVDNNSLQGPITPNLGRAVSLRYLDLGYNSMAGEIPTEMYQLTRLTFLRLENNNLLTGRIPTEFGRFTDLEFFSISDTNIRARIPSQYGALTKLTDFRMANTLVGGDFPEEIGDLNELSNGDFADSRFRKQIPTVLGNFRDMGKWRSLSVATFSLCIPVNGFFFAIRPWPSRITKSTSTSETMD